MAGTCGRRYAGAATQYNGWPVLGAKYILECHAIAVPALRELLDAAAAATSWDVTKGYGYSWPADPMADGGYGRSITVVADGPGLSLAAKGAVSVSDSDEYAPHWTADTGTAALLGGTVVTGHSVAMVIMRAWAAAAGTATLLDAIQP